MKLKKKIGKFMQRVVDHAMGNGLMQEETAAFFGGQKNAKDVAHIVQSRAQIYVNENR